MIFLKENFFLKNQPVTSTLKKSSCVGPVQGLYQRQNHLLSFQFIVPHSLKQL
jgi:hypothetical protein